MRIRKKIAASTEDFAVATMQEHHISFDFAHYGYYSEDDMEDYICEAIDMVTNFTFSKSDAYNNYIGYIDFDAIDYDPAEYPEVVGKETSQCNVTFFCEMPIDPEKLAYTLVDIVEKDPDLIVLGTMVDGGYY